MVKAPSMPCVERNEGGDGLRHRRVALHSIKGLKVWTAWKGMGFKRVMRSWAAYGGASGGGGLLGRPEQTAERTILFE